MKIKEEGEGGGDKRGSVGGTVLINAGKSPSHGDIKYIRSV